MAEKVTNEDLELLGELGVEAGSEQADIHSAREQRIIAGFEEIERFVDKNGREPQHGEQRDIFERLYAVRLERIRASAECRNVLTGRDPRGLLSSSATTDETSVGEDATEYDPTPPESTDVNDAALLAQLGVDASSDVEDILALKHVRPREALRTAEEVAQRTACKDFDEFKSLFAQVQLDLHSGKRQSLKFQDNAEVRKGDLFILEGQKAVVAELGELFVSEYDRPDRRLRVIYDNGTESALLLRSLQRALNKDKASRRITEGTLGPIFSSDQDGDDLPTGYIYVLRSCSEHPFVVEHRTVLHKIGVTGGDVKTRVANASKDPTYLLADVEIVATYMLANINRKQLEALLHKFFGAARLDLELKDRFGFDVAPREWYLVPLSVIDEAIHLLMSGTIGSFRYHPEKAQIISG